jgi:hypothetical protein
MFKPIEKYKNRPQKSGLPSAGIGKLYLLLTDKKEKKREVRKVKKLAVVKGGGLGAFYDDS